MFCVIVSHVICKIWGNFQGKVGSKFTCVYVHVDGEFCRPPTLIESPTGLQKTAYNSF